MHLSLNILVQYQGLMCLHICWMYNSHTFARKLNDCISFASTARFCFSQVVKSQVVNLYFLGLICPLVTLLLAWCILVRSYGVRALTPDVTAVISTVTLWSIPHDLAVIYRLSDYLELEVNDFNDFNKFYS